MKQKLYTLTTLFLKGNKSASVLFCNNGIYQVSVKELTNPTYYHSDTKIFDADTKKFEIVSSYGSPFKADVLREINTRDF